MDPVPMIPRMTGYYHVKGLKHITEEDNKFKIFDYNKPYQKFNSWLFSLFKVIYFSSKANHSLSEYEERIKCCNC